MNKSVFLYWWFSFDLQYYFILGGTNNVLHFSVTKVLKNTLKENYYISNSFTGIFKGLTTIPGQLQCNAQQNFSTPIFVEYFSMAASTNKKSILIETRSLQNRKTFRKQRKRKMGKTISSVKLFASILHV